ncbi:hypothetical protein HDU99_000485 [Rhizoclosmatium hyalinum]|nr:hypothetical protein HDU99_000485 [Rhizoclosmatium hyalinum]
MQNNTSVSGSSHTGTTANIQFLQSNVFKFQHDKTLRVPHVNSVRYQQAVFAVQEEVHYQSTISPTTREVENKSKNEDVSVQMAVGKILRRALDAADPIDDGGGRFVLLRECSLPSVDNLSAKATDPQPLALPFHFPTSGKADFGIGLAPPNSFRAAKSSRQSWEWEVANNYPALGLPVASLIEVKRENTIDVGTCTTSSPPKHNGAIVQTAAYTLYSMLGILSQLSEHDKLRVFGENIEMYGLLLTQKSAFIIKVTPCGFYDSGKFTVVWSEQLNGDEYAQNVVSFVFESIRLLNQVKVLVPIPFPKPSRFCWLPAKEYKRKFSFLEGEPILYTQTFTNPIIKFGNYYCRIYRSHFAKTQDSRLSDLEALFRINALNSRAQQLEQRLERVQEAVLRNASKTETLAIANEPLPQIPVNPFENWVLSEPFMALPDYGPSLHNRIFPKPPALIPNITFSMIKNLVLSVYRNSICSLVAVNYCHMDIRLGNICTSKDDWSDSHLIDYDFCAPANGVRENPMSKSRLQYPLDEKVVPSSDVWMFGYVLAQLGGKLEGVRHVIDGSVSTHEALEEWAQSQLNLAQMVFADSEDYFVESSTIALKVKFLQVVAGCLKVQAVSRFSFAKIVEQVNEWAC